MSIFNKWKDIFTLWIIVGVALIENLFEALFLLGFIISRDIKLIRVGTGIFVLGILLIEYILRWEKDDIN